MVLGLGHTTGRVVGRIVLTVVLAAMLTVVGGLVVGNANAQTGGENGALVYPAAYFDQFSPRTALQMVRQVPGFAFNEDDDDDARGFGTASANVLINGKRISGKSNGVTEVLERIPANTVDRIELVDGASLDIPGLSGQVVNVIAQVSGVSGVYEWQALWREDLPPYYNGVEFSVTGERGGLGWTVSLESDPDRRGARGLETVRDGDGELYELRVEELDMITEEYIGAVALNWGRNNGDEANLSVQYGAKAYEQTEESFRSPLDGRDGTLRVFQTDEDTFALESGGDYALTLGPGRLKFIGLYARTVEPVVSETVSVALTGDVLSERRFERDLTESESIARLEYGWTPTQGRDWQVSLEGVYNLLEAESALFTRDAGGGLEAVDLADPKTQVDEVRAEAFLTHTRSVSPRWTVQGGLGGEYSVLATGANSEQDSGQASGAGQERSFTRPKGFFTTSFAPAETTSWAVRVERSVGQLDFLDFVSSQDLDVDQSTQGNGQIVPQQSWDGSVQLDHQFGGLGAGTVRVFGSLIEDRVENIPLGADSEGPGNVDRAHLYGIELAFTVNLETIGWDGVTVEVEGFWQDSSVDDPLTGQARAFSGETVYDHQLDVRHDIPGTDWAWGVGLAVQEQAQDYRLDAVSLFELAPVNSWMWLEHKNIGGLNGRVSVFNLFDRDVNFSQDFYTPNRTGALLRAEDRSRNYGPVLRLRLSGTF